MILLLSVWGPRIRLIVRPMLVSFLRGVSGFTGSPDKCPIILLQKSLNTDI